jgi:hypothetical protein
VQLNPAWAADHSQPKYISLPTTCTGSEQITGILKISVDQNATTRYGFRVFADILVDGVFSTTFAYCDPSNFGSGIAAIYVENSPITWTCGTRLEIRNLFVGWGINANVNGNACFPSNACELGPHCAQFPLHNEPPIVVITPLSADFGISGSCQTANVYTFDALSATNGTTGGTPTGTPPTYTSFSWSVKNPANAEIGTGSSSTLVFDFGSYAAGTYTVALTVTDDNPSATSTVSHTVTVASCCDNVPPVISPSGTTTTLGCNPSAGDIDAALGSATASDAGDNSSVTVTPSDGAVSSDGCNRSQTRTFHATDACSNTASASRTVTWKVDVTAPGIVGVGSNQNLGCNPTNINDNFSTPTATDGCGGATITSVVTGDDVAGPNCSVSRTRTWTATDDCNRTATASQTLTWKVDITAPGIVGVGSNQNLGCNPTDINSSFSNPTATDGCGGATITSVVTGDDVPGANCSISRTRTWTATDDCNRTATASQTLTWKIDITAPVIVGVGDNQNLGCNPADINGNFSNPTATDGCGGATITSIVTGSDVSGANCSISRKRTWTATDDCNRTATASQTLTWKVDVTAPGIVGVGGNQNLGCNPTDINGNFSNPTATDGCGGATITSVVTGDDVAGANCSISRKRTWTATDDCNRTASASQTLTWKVDVTAPVIVGVGGNQNLGCNPTYINGNFSSPTATDGCGGATITNVVTGSDVPGTNCSISRTRTWTATDDCNRTVTASQTLTWKVDVTAPGFVGVGGNQNLGCNPTDINGNFSNPTATDGCGGATITNVVTGSDVPGANCSISRTRTWTATDDCNRTAAASQTLTWKVDVTAPGFVGVGSNQNLGCNPTNINGNFSNPTATDGCGGATITSTVTGDDVTGANCSISRTRTWTATDGCNRTATASQTLTWKADLVRPVFTGSYSAVTLGCSPSASDIEAALGTATATDGCGTPTVTILSTSAASGTGGCRTQTRTFRAIDGCSNTATVSRRVNWTVPLTDGCWTINLRSVTAVGGNTTYLFEICGNGCPYALSNIAFLTGSRRVISPVNGSTYNYAGAPDINYTVVTPVSRNVNGVKFETFVGVEGIKNGCDIFEFTVEGAPVTITVEIKAGKAKANSIVVDPICVCSQPQSLITRASVTSEVASEVVSTATVTAYPNPYSDQVMFRILSPVSGRASLEAYDFLGRKMAVIYQGNVEAGVQRTVTYKIPATQRVPMIYTLRVGDRIINGKLFPNGAIHY